MKMVAYFAAGLIFGIALVKGEAVSWYRMQEMFHFQSFHMFGIFMTAIPTAAAGVWLLKLRGKTVSGKPLIVPTKEFRTGTIAGSLLFGFGWAMTGACPGPFYVQIGAGMASAAVMLFFALAGTWFYGLVKDRLPE